MNLTATFKKLLTTSPIVAATVYAASFLCCLRWL
jgi:hypothetical protein